MSASLQLATLKFSHSFTLDFFSLVVVLVKIPSFCFVKLVALLMAGRSYGSSKNAIRVSSEALEDNQSSFSGFEKRDSSDDDPERRLLSSTEVEDDRAQALQPNQTFQTFGSPALYKPIEGYEGAHRYDPKFEWEPKEEKKLVRKVCSIVDVSSINGTEPCSWTCAYVLGSA